MGDDDLVEEDQTVKAANILERLQAEAKAKKQVLQATSPKDKLLDHGKTKSADSHIESIDRKVDLHAYKTANDRDEGKSEKSLSYHMTSRLGVK